MRVVVCVPYRGGDTHRERNWAFARPRWEALGWPIVTADAGGRLFSRAGSRNAAARDAGGWDVALFVDSDIVVRELEPVLAAVDFAAEVGAMVLPHDECVGLTAGGTARVVAGRDDWARVKRIQQAPSGLFAIARDAWDAVGGQDERFSGWGFEDSSFLAAVGTLARAVRRPGRIYHLWHPVAAEKIARDATYQANLALRARYRAATGDTAAMRALLDERLATAA